MVEPDEDLWGRGLSPPRDAPRQHRPSVGRASIGSRRRESMDLRDPNQLHSNQHHNPYDLNDHGRHSTYMEHTPRYHHAPGGGGSTLLGVPEPVPYLNGGGSDHHGRSRSRRRSSMQ